MKKTTVQVQDTNDIINNTTITYQQLSKPLRIAIITAWVLLTIWTIAFIYGFITAMIK